MPSPITGTDGGLRIKRPNGQSLYFTWIGKWTFKSERKTDDIGPHIGDATIYPVAGAKKGTYALEGTIPQDGMWPKTPCSMPTKRATRLSSNCTPYVGGASCSLARSTPASRSP